MRCLSDNTVNTALRRLGYSKEEMTGHGFRAMASACVNEQDWHPDVIELLQGAHYFCSGCHHSQQVSLHEYAR